MAESIFARVSRLLSATVEDTVDRMEQAGGDAVMREATAVIGSFAPQLAYPKAFDTAACDRALAGSGIARSSMRAAYLETVRYLVGAK